MQMMDDVLGWVLIVIALIFAGVNAASELDADEYAEVLSNVRSGEYVAADVLEAINDDGEITQWESYWFPQGGEERRLAEMKAKVRALEKDRSFPGSAAAANDAAAYDKQADAVRQVLAAKLAAN